MKTFFEVIPETLQEEDCALCCEISSEGVSFTIKNLQEQKFVGVAVYNFDKNRPQEGFHIALQVLFNTKSFLSKPYQKVTVVYSLPESALIPLPLYDSESVSDALDLLFGTVQSDAVVLTDLITEQGYYNCFRVPDTIHDIVEKQFPVHTSFHQYSGLAGSHSSGENKLFIIFYSQKLVVSLFADGKCRLVNSFNYQFAEDVSFYLLTIREQHQVPDIPLEVSGFIEKDSTLYIELYKYFKDISFSPLPGFCEYSDEILHYPSHYFSHLFESDPCG